jgi:hypothetical protein
MNEYRYFEKRTFTSGDKIRVGEIVKVNSLTGKPAPDEKHKHVTIDLNLVSRSSAWRETTASKYITETTTPILEKKETHMSTKIKVVTQINGANEDTFSTAQLLELIKGAQNEIASLEEIEATSTFVSKQINEQRDVINTLIELLDAR